MRRPTALLGKPGSMVVAPENSYAAFRNRNYSVSGVESSRRVGGEARPHSRGNLSRRSGMRPDSRPNGLCGPPQASADESTAKAASGVPGRPTRLEKAFFLVLLALILAIPLAATVKCYRRGLPLLSGSDSEQYYAILRAFVFHGDADLRHELFQLTPSAKDFRGQLPIAPQTGRIAEKHTVGWAVVGFVPYLGVHACYLLARHLGCGPAILTGYELPYQVAAGFAQLAAGWLGLIFTYRLCRRYFAMWPSLAALGCRPFRQCFVRLLREPVHGPRGRFLRRLRLPLLLRQAGRCDRGQEAGLGLGGLRGGPHDHLTANQRPVSAGRVVPLGIAAQTRSAEGRYLLVRGVAVAGLAAAPFLALQSLFWRGAFGKWLVFSYGTAEERFFWTRPELLNYLFSPKHGLLFSSPLMVLAALGLLLIVARGSGPRRLLAVLVCVSTSLLIYANSAWHDWAFGCGFACRSFVDASAPACLGLAAIFSMPGKRIRSTAMIAACFAVAWTCLLFLLFLLHYIDGWGNFTLRR